ncbi:putative glutathione-regulated potassium-efflux system protein [Sterolibacterium denitrificans]|uniref:Potassium transporter n=2 Tax=Sterolibacterium denitrificans TaxID=157592 RepID=A0A656Z911_9PROT|nr:monovalent cation:proton antiporter family protein [Sterolibacterium denitrificans]KYC29457.1 potassium transporter [Sterolibacterium denitrificans]SMB31660.1 putative glutathione-regulated potassium-efflux system protein [Sterolibacterium denitrificans]
MSTTLELVLLLLASSVVIVALFRFLHLPPIIGYLLVGALIGPNALKLMPNTEDARHLAEFGVVFLMFTIGLEFSLPHLFSMKRMVFGLGLAQVGLTMATILLLAIFSGLSWQGALALGGVLAMSSTAVASKLLVERSELDSPHGRQIMGVLLFQDLAVVPLLILFPALAGEDDALFTTLLMALFKAAVVLTIVLFFGQRLMRAWFTMVARRKSTELFMLNVLFITLGLSWLTEKTGLSLALGAFLAGMLISETEYRFKVEEDIKPFRDVLLGLFFITVGMYLDPRLIAQHFLFVIALLVALLLLKLLVVLGLARLFGATPGTALRSGLWLCAGGEFGFVLLTLGLEQHLLDPSVTQTVLAAMVLSLLAAPLLIHFSDRLVLRLVASEWMLRSMALTQIAARSITNDKHAILCGYGRTGQHLARFLERENIPLVALDLDPERVREAAAAGDSVVFGDASQRETLIAAGIHRANVIVVTSNDAQLALRVLHHAHELRPDLPVVVRAMEERDIARFEAAGAAEVVPEALESSVMLATHALALLGVPMQRVIRLLREARQQRYALLRGFFHGMSDSTEHLSDAAQIRLRSVALLAGSHAAGRSLTELALEKLDVSVLSLRRRGTRSIAPSAETRLDDSDILVLQGTSSALAAAEERLLRGK